MKKMSLLLLAFITLVTTAFGQTNGPCYIDGVRHSTMPAALTCAGPSGTIEITPAVGTLVIEGDTSIPSGVALRIDGGAVLSIPAGARLTINGPLQAPAARIFSYSGNSSVSLGSLAAEHVMVNWFPGADIGEQFTNALAALPASGGTLYPALGSYQFAKTVDFTSGTKAVTVQCEKGSYNSNGTSYSGPTTLIYTGSGPAFVFNGNTHSGMSGCTLVGPDGTTDQTAQGVVIGGSGGGVFDNFSQNDISGFGNGGLIISSNTYIVMLQENVIHDNGPNGSSNVIVPSGVTQEGENITFLGGLLGNKSSSFSQSCVNLKSSGEYKFNHVSFDQCGVEGNALDVELFFSDSHMENPNGATSNSWVTLGANCSWCMLEWRGGSIREDYSSSRTDFFEDDSTVANVNNQINIESGVMVPAEIMTPKTGALVYINHPCCDAVTVGPVQNGQGGYTFAEMVGGNARSGLAIGTDYLDIMGRGSVPVAASGHTQLYVDSSTQRWVMNNGNNGAEFIPGSFHQLVVPFAPTIAAGGCGGSGASIPTNNGPASFTINVGLAPASTCAFTLPITASNGWNCTASDLTTTSSSVFLQKQTGSSATDAAITNFNDVASVSNFVAGDVLAVSCLAR